jgi:DNA-binding response OmpR family regulator
MGINQSESGEETPQLLLVDDDAKYCRLIANYLSTFGYSVHAVHDGSQGISAGLEHQWHAIMLDVMLPAVDGLSVLQRIRSKSSVPIMMLTNLGDEADRIVGLEYGADDYVSKTASPRELLARLRALLRRASFRHGDHKTITVGPLTIDTEGHNVMLHGEVVKLTPVEFEILSSLAGAHGRVKSREDLLSEIRDRNYDIFDRSVDVHISALRRKLNDDPRNPRLIHTVRAAGYKLSFTEIA